MSISYGMSSFLSLRRIFYFTFVLLLFFSSTAVFAQEAGVSIKPVTIEETLDPGTVKEYTLSIENLHPREETFYLFTRDISTVREGGVPIFADPGLDKTGYELSEWINLSETEIIVPANTSRKVTFVMSVPEDASPGSHFGGVFVSKQAPKIEKSGAAIGYQVANIISIRVSGEAVVDANVRQFSTSQFLYHSQDVDFDVRIENLGNVLIRPMGPLVISNMFGQKVGTVLFNENQAGVFPGATEGFEGIEWHGDSVGFGKYEAVLSAGYGDRGAQKTMSSTVTFWILPMHIVGPVLGVLAVLLLVVYLFIRAYIKRSLAQASYGRRVVRRKKKAGSSPVMLFVVVMLMVTALFMIILLALFA